MLAGRSVGTQRVCLKWTILQPFLYILLKTTRQFSQVSLTHQALLTEAWLETAIAPRLASANSLRASRLRGRNSNYSQAKSNNKDQKVCAAEENDEKARNGVGPEEESSKENRREGTKRSPSSAHPALGFCGYPKLIQLPEAAQGSPCHQGDKIEDHVLFWLNFLFERDET